MKNLLWLAVLAWISGISTSLVAAETKGPNIVVILADDYGWGSVGCYGGKGLQTPNLDRLAKEGRLFRHAYAPGSVCSPTRYALMTGRYFWRTSVKDGMVLPGNGPLHIETNRTTLASVAKSKGYATAAIGKWHLGLGLKKQVDWNAPLTPGPRALGLDYFFGLAANIGNPPPAYIENEELVGRKAGDLVTVEGNKAVSTNSFTVERLPEGVMPMLTEKCVRWIEKNKQKPFFVYFAPNAVHEPITPASQFNGSKFGKYGDFITELDLSVGKVLEALDKNKLADNTLILFTSDNGGVAQAQNPTAGAAMKAGLAINGVLRGGKHDIWEGGFREPYILRWPGKVPAGTTCDDIVSISDTLATLAGILNVPVSKGNAEDSFDVSSSWLGKGKPARDYIVLQDASATYAIRKGPWKLIERENAPPVPLRNAKGERRQAKALKKGTPTHDELYNLVDDPGEKKDVASTHPDIVKELRQLLASTRNADRSPR